MERPSAHSLTRRSLIAAYRGRDRDRERACDAGTILGQQAQRFGSGHRVSPQSRLRRARSAAWPRRAAGHESDIRDQDIRDLALPLGLGDVKVAALDQDWSGLRLVWRKERRAASPARPG